MNKILLYFLSLFAQLSYLPFLFWFLELIQNNLTMLVTGSYGWYYPTSLYGYFHFKSLLSWTICVSVFWSLYFLIFKPLKVPLPVCILITTIVGWVSEWILGYTAVHVFKSPMQVWPNTSLVYVSYGAIGWWVMNSVIFYFVAFLLPRHISYLLKRMELIQ
jgi:hypothetical protein